MSEEPGQSAIPDSFEERIERLEQIVGELEAGEAPLEQSLALFEEGVALARACRDQIEDARQRVEVLLGSEEGEAETRPLEEEEG